MSKKIVYIAHPIGGDVQGNLKKVAAIGRQINLTEPDVVPFAPYYFACHCLDDKNDVERQRGIDNDVAMIRSGIVDEMRLYGDGISQGMWSEIWLAEGLRIPVRPMTAGTMAEYLHYLEDNYRINIG